MMMMMMMCVCVFLQIAAVPAEGTASTDSLQPTNGNPPKLMMMMMMMMCVRVCRSLPFQQRERPAQTPFNPRVRCARPLPLIGELYLANPTPHTLPLVWYIWPTQPPHR
jgi:hypothetical protein